MKIDNTPISSEKRNLVVELFYKSMTHDAIAKTLSISSASVSHIVTDFLKDCKFKEVNSLDQIKAIEKKLFYYLYKEAETIEDKKEYDKIIDELTPIYARHCAN